MAGSEGSGGISPTAHYTGDTLRQHGLSHPPAAPNAASRMLGGPTLGSLLLARHRIIDALRDDLIEGGVSQVIEAACGMSPRGWRFSERYGDRITYVEADLPAMAQRQREELARVGFLR